VASRTHRIPAYLAWGCALLLGVGLSGCAAQDTGVSDPTGQVHFTVPSGWQPTAPPRWLRWRAAFRLR